MKPLFVRFAQGLSGTTAIEYALIAAGISIAIVVVVGQVGSSVVTLFGSVSTALQ